MEKAPSGPLRGLRVLDLTRVLAGPTCTQMLGDMGAEVIKIERPESGDDTRGFAPPVWPGTTESAYFLGVNRNKKSLTLDIAKEEGQAIIHQLLETCDILVENFKVGALAKYGLGFDQLKAKYPGLIYCSITGFGQTGPYAPRPGYDALIQGMGGVMSLTGEPEGLPQKVGVPVADLFAGLYGCIGILAALRHRERTGQGQQIDIGMLDTSVAWLANQGMNYLATGENPPRLGNQHPNIAPYQVFPTKDGHIVLSVGNDPTFERFCKSFGCEAMLEDPRFATNAERVANRDAVTATLTPVMQSKTTAEWVAALEERKIGCGPINKLSDVFADPHVKARGCTVDLTLSNGAAVTVIANPVRLSATPADYRIAPPLLGEHSEEVLTGLLGMTEAQVQALKDKGVV
ncbi:CaiB/BaiF CoA transferase family protein [Falsiroseomonas stagni]|uniref:Crotonobetainyl-CoA:carnitine CoA-transferase CaiB n=1 Tax=Falsiroseomonas stagni DSM 19981 TaxID=1123062 RepID=A0A1I4ART1_9PROT|nr:CaiB/BaiF CoA-transferase family protein [Falsiroseomonas stagni]SFK58930.1 Crotonobetainyl-CoA:carnitine CoA-transferase CaiB [Falsiroseomonas stagni DSM 19981]